jgi:VanZ family protein
VPLGYLLMAWLHRGAGRGSVPRGLLALALCVALAVAVEFTQIWFAPRTVSLNDLVAEVLGGSLGIALWYALRGTVGQRFRDLLAGGGHALEAALVAYAVAYIALSLFPFDFLVSRAELAWKLSSDRVGLLLAGGGCEGLTRCVAGRAAEVVATLPLGLLVALRRPRTGAVPAALGHGLMLGAALEAAQFFTASGVSQGLSVLTRMAGLGLGAWLSARVPLWARRPVAPALAWVVLGLAVPYLLVVPALAGWPGGGGPLPVGEALARLDPRMVMPFYFHYFTPESAAMQSLLANAALYLPGAVGYWLWAEARGRPATAATAAVLAVGLAAVVELGKLFVPAKHPDFTNLLIAGLASAATVTAIRWTRRQLAGPGTFARGPAPQAPTAALAPPTRRAGVLRVMLALAVLVPVGWAVLRYPVVPGWLAAALALHAWLLWQDPRRWLFLVPALLPVFDFAAWSGWFFFDELDLLLLVTVAVLLLRLEPAPAGPAPLLRGAAWLIGGFTLALLASLARGLLPLTPLDANAFASYLSPWNALRVGKAWLWALVLLPFLRHALAEAGAARRYLFPGLLAGLAATVGMAVWERAVFPGLLNYASDYRTTALFSSMHTGGASIDAYLALALPVIGACFLVWRGAGSHALGLALFALGLYTSLVTFSRIGYVALAVAGAILVVGLARERASDARFLAVVVPASVVAAVVAVPVFLAPYVHVRLSTTAQDAEIRADHWGEVLGLRDGSVQTHLLGMGLGSFPRVYFWADPGPARPGTFSYVNEGGEAFLRLGSGRPVYLLQRLRLGAGTRYRVSVDLRAAAGAGSLAALVCEKSLLYSLNCKSESWRTPKADGWARQEGRLDLTELARRGRPLSLALYNGSRGTLIDVDDLSLRDEQGRELIANGGFERGQDRWFFTSDDHLSWHTKNLWVQLLFEQGWLGMLLFMALTTSALARLVAGMRGRDAVATVLLASLASGLAVGLSDGILDAPRVALLLYLLVLTSLLHRGSAGAARDEVDGRGTQGRRRT